MFEPIFVCALGLALLSRGITTLRLDASDCDHLYRLFHPWDEDQAKRLLHNAVNRLCIQLLFFSKDEEKRAEAKQDK